MKKISSSNAPPTFSSLFSQRSSSSDIVHALSTAASLDSFGEVHVKFEGNKFKSQNRKGKDTYNKKPLLSSSRLHELGLRQSDTPSSNALDSLVLPVPRSRSVNDLFGQPKKSASIDNPKSKKKTMMHRNLQAKSSDSFGSVDSQAKSSQISSKERRSSFSSSPRSPGRKGNNRSHTQGKDTKGRGTQQKGDSSYSKTGPFKSVLQVLAWCHKQEDAKIHTHTHTHTSSGLSDIFENVYRPALQHLTIYATEPCDQYRQSAPAAENFKDYLVPPPPVPCCWRRRKKQAANAGGYS